MCVTDFVVLFVFACRPKNVRSRSRSPKGWKSPSRRYLCLECNRECSSQSNLKRHVDEQHGTQPEATRLRCPHQHCGHSFVRKHDLERHWRPHDRGQGPAGESASGSASRSLGVVSTPEVPRTPGREMDTLSLHPRSAEREIVLAPLSPPQVRRSIEMPLVRVSEPQSTTTPARPAIFKEAATQTDGRHMHRLAERTIQEMLDGEGKVTARIVREKFFPE